MRGISWLAANRLVSQEGLCTVECVSKCSACVDRTAGDRAANIPSATQQLPHLHESKCPSPSSQAQGSHTYPEQINPLNNFLKHVFNTQFNIMSPSVSTTLTGQLYANSPAGFCTQLSVTTNTKAATHIIIIIIIMLSVLRQPLPKPALHTVRSSASASNFKYLLVSLRASRSCLCCLLLFLFLFLRVLVRSIFYSIPCFRSHFSSNTWPIQLAFRRCTVSRIHLSSLALCNTSFFTRSVQQIFSIILPAQIFKTSKVFLFQNPTDLPYFGDCVSIS